MVLDSFSDLESTDESVKEGEEIVKPRWTKGGHKKVLLLMAGPLRGGGGG